MSKKTKTHDHEIMKHILDWENDMLRYGDEGPIVEKSEKKKDKKPT